MAVQPIHATCANSPRWGKLVWDRFLRSAAGSDTGVPERALHGCVRRGQGDGPSFVQVSETLDPMRPTDPHGYFNPHAESREDYLISGTLLVIAFVMILMLYAIRTHLSVAPGEAGTHHGHARERTALAPVR